jgi:protocatechuate 3,4-dioxygenase beta subunit
MPLDQDNDLLILNDNLTTALGQVSWVSGRVLGRTGTPLRNALVEIWQADNNGAYIHSASPIANRDGNFQGYGKFLTGSRGEYLFRTVKPGLYPGRTRHIHFKITAATGETLVTQLYVQGEPLNTNDGVLNGIPAAQRSLVVVPWNAYPGTITNELAASFDIVMGLTPADPPASKPSILSTGGVVNGAGYQAGITPGAWLTIFGDNLSATSRMWNSNEIVEGKLPTSLDGVSVTINGKRAAVYYVSPNQINVQAPSDTTSGKVQVTVTNAVGTSDPVTAEISAYQPGFFLYPRNYVAAVRTDGSCVGPTGLFDGLATRPAAPGDQISIYGTGFGPTNPSIAAGEVFQGAAPLSSNIRVRIGAVDAIVAFAGLSSTGVYQINLTVPTLPDGDHDVFAYVAGVRSQPLARLRVQR